MSNFYITIFSVQRFVEKIKNGNLIIDAKLIGRLLKLIDISTFQSTIP